jgi:hypothetical protein
MESTNEVGLVPELLSPPEKDILEKITQYFNSLGIPFIISSSFLNNNKVRDIDICLPGNQAGFDLAGLSKLFPNLEWSGIMGGTRPPTSKLTPSPYQIYNSAGITTAKINSHMIDFIAGYTLKVWQANQANGNQVDFSKAISQPAFCEAGNGLCFLSPLLKLLKSYLEIRYIEESSLEEWERGEVYDWGKIKNSCYENFILGLKQLRSSNQHSLTSVRDFLLLQPENFTDSETVERLYGDFITFCSRQDLR